MINNSNSNFIIIIYIKKWNLLDKGVRNILKITLILKIHYLEILLKSLLKNRKYKKIFELKMNN
jgi:hypothetical protein